MLNDNPTLDAVIEGMARAICETEGGTPDDVVYCSAARDDVIYWTLFTPEARAALSSEPITSLLKRAVEALGPISSTVGVHGLIYKDVAKAASVLADLKALTEGVRG